jgi:NAD(P)-dependent dehydrogenase (short-subunit alcohol dehydrogenase family)
VDNPLRTSGGPLNWFVTGAGSGLGRAITELALAQGDAVVATDLRPDALGQLKEDYPDRLSLRQLDVTDAAAIDSTVSCVAEDHGSIDVVVNCAGYAVVGATEEMTGAQVDHQLATLLHGPIRITCAFLPALREQGGGRIIQISSIGGQVAFPVSSIYHAAKWGLEGFTESVSQEVDEFGIYFTIVEPGSMRTGFAAHVKVTEETPAYRSGAVGRFRRWMSTATDDVYVNDPSKLAQAIFETTRSAKPPLRLTLGGDAYDAIHAALRDRLQALESQQEIARSVAFDASPA